MKRADPLRTAFATSDAAISAVYYYALARAGPD
jgi:hypothetical protein